MRIFLIGFMGCGKSTIGRQLAHYLTFEYADMDKIITSHAGMSIQQIFDTKGEAWFREQETAAIYELLQQDNLVIATGGGVPCFYKNMDLMNRHGITVYLRMNPTALFERLKNSKINRPLINGKKPEELMDFINRLLKEREPFYRQAALVVDSATITPDMLRDAILETAKKDPQK